MTQETEIVKTTTSGEKIALVVWPAWVYYCHQLGDSIAPKSLQKKIGREEAEIILDALPNITRAEACFLALIAEIISGEDSPEIGVAPAGEQPISSIGVFDNKTCPARKLCPVMRWFGRK